MFKMIDKQLKRDILTIIDYMWEDEQRHYEEDVARHHIGNVHIFEIMKRVKNKIKIRGVTNGKK